MGQRLGLWWFIEFFLWCVDCQSWKPTYLVFDMVPEFSSGMDNRSCCQNLNKGHRVHKGTKVYNSQTFRRRRVNERSSFKFLDFLGKLWDSWVLKAISSNLQGLFCQTTNKAQEFLGITVHSILERLNWVCLGEGEKLTPYDFIICSS